MLTVFPCQPARYTITSRSGLPRNVQKIIDQSVPRAQFLKTINFVTALHSPLSSSPLTDLFDGTGCEAEGSPAFLAGDTQLTHLNIRRCTCWDSFTGYTRSSLRRPR